MNKTFLIYRDEDNNKKEGKTQSFVLKKTFSQTKAKCTEYNLSKNEANSPNEKANGVKSTNCCPNCKTKCAMNKTQQVLLISLLGSWSNCSLYNQFFQVGPAMISVRSIKVEKTWVTIAQGYIVKNNSFKKFRKVRMLAKYSIQSKTQ